MSTSATHTLRRAFTLVELLVVIILIAILAGISAMFLPAIGDSARQTQGATMLQQWILTAKQKALRDQVPCGLRLIPNPDKSTWFPKNNPSKATQVINCQFIEQPDDYTIRPQAGIPLTGAGSNFVGAIKSDPPPPQPNRDRYVVQRVQICTRYPDGSNVPLDKYIGRGDYLEICGNGLLHSIVQPPSPDPNNPGWTEIYLDSPVFYQVHNVAAGQLNYKAPWRVIRSPRPTGDDILQLPDSVIIDIRSNEIANNPLPYNTLTGTIDIIFSPTGAVITPGLTTDSINLWVRMYDPTPRAGIDPFDADPNHSEQTIVAVFARSGLTASHPPAPRPWGRYGPYAYIIDGRTSGK